MKSPHDRMIYDFQVLDERANRGDALGRDQIQHQLIRRARRNARHRRAEGREGDLRVRQGPAESESLGTNMLAGVGAVDACLFVVAATEGWKPQSEEHLRIVELLGIEHGVIALTKVGIVDDDHAELARLEVIDHVAGTFLDGAEIVRTIGIVRARCKIGMTNLVYNMRRFIILERMAEVAR